MSNPADVHPILQFKPTPAEAGKLSRLMRRKQKLRKEYVSLTSMPYKEMIQYFHKCKPIDAELDALAAEIGKRTLGELPLTLRTDRSEKTGQNPVVVLSIKIESGFDTQYSWHGRGVRLRKDGSVGLIDGQLRLDNRQVWRRQLDGGWTPLITQHEGLNRANKC